MNSADPIAQFLKARLDSSWGPLDWDKLIYQYLTAERKKVVGALTPIDAVRAEFNADASTALVETLDWMRQQDLIVSPTGHPDLLMLSPLGYAWVESNGDIDAARAAVSRPISGFVQKRMDRSVGSAKESLNELDASYLLLLFMAGATSEADGLRIDRTGKEFAQPTCDLLNYILKMTKADKPKTKKTWTIDQLHNYGRAKSLDKKTTFDGTRNLVMHQDWKQSALPRAWIADDRDETLSALLSMILAALDVERTTQLIRRHASRPIYSDVDAPAADFAKMFGHVDVPHSYRKRLLSLAEAAATQI